MANKSPTLGNRLQAVFWDVCWGAAAGPCVAHTFAKVPVSALQRLPFDLEAWSQNMPLHKVSVYSTNSRPAGFGDSWSSISSLP